MIVCTLDRSVTYPKPDDDYSPSEAYPEYRFSHLSRHTNKVYGAVRELFRQSGLDSARYDSPDWNPLGRWIRPGQRVFVLCNFVYHRRSVESETDFLAKCTHGSVLRAFLDYALLAAGPEGSVRFGNAPLQSCDWEAVLRETGAGRLPAFYRGQGYQVDASDLRLYVSKKDALGRTVGESLRDSRGGVEFRLGKSSFLDPLRCRPEKFRVADYDPRETSSYHSAGEHRYVINRQVLEADVLVSLPKLKTHEKVGLTCCLKGFVGAVGLKQCLAHHRSGSPEAGGDEMPSGAWLTALASRLQDKALLTERGSFLRGVLDVADRNIRRVLVRCGATMAGAWRGNDTAWRMTLDLARLLVQGDLEGQMREIPQRIHLALVDGIIGGEGEGPLAPGPVKSGLLLFADNPAVADLACSNLIGFDAERIPLVREALSAQVFGPADLGSANVIANGAPSPLASLPQFNSLKFRPPHGWRNWVERNDANSSATTA